MGRTKLAPPATNRAPMPASYDTVMLSRLPDAKNLISMNLPLLDLRCRYATVADFSHNPYTLGA